MDNNTDLDTSTPDSKATYVLSNVVEVVERILTFVPTKSLLKIASVCRLWSNCARRVLRTQQQMTWVSACGPSNTEVHALCNTLYEEVKKVFLLPKMVLAIMDCETFKVPFYCHRQKKSKRSRHSPVEEVTSVFPRNCSVLGITTPGIVLTPTGSHSRPPEEHQEGEAGFAIMFPSMEGVKIKPLHFCQNSLSTSAMKEAGLIDNPELRVVLLFVYEVYKSGGARFLNEILEPLAKSKALIAGGLVESSFPTRLCCGRGGYGMVGLALSGPKVQGASVLLDQDVSTPKEAESTIRRLKAANIPERNTLGFMFACVGRGQNYYNNQRNVEADAFRKVFPGVPLFGLFGNGEIGCDRIVKDDYTLCDDDTDCLQHEYTTVMTLVHLG
ncbi:F-box only protein 22 [Stigmatopora argus]